MTQLYIAPKWFFGYDIALELLFAVVTLAVALSSWYIYRICEQRECKLFGFGFLSISFSYFLWSAINLFISTRLSDSTSVIALDKLSTLGFIGVYGHMIFLILGLATLAYTTLNTKGYRAYSLFVSLSLVLIIFSAQKAIAFYFLSSLLFFYILLHYIIEFRNQEKKRAPLVMIAFIFLFLGSLDFTFASINHVPYVVGHLLQFIGYTIILASLVKTLKL